MFMLGRERSEGLTVGLEKLPRPLRWVLVVPFAFVASGACQAVVSVVARNNFYAASDYIGIIYSMIAGVVGGLAFVAAAAFTAPSRQPVVGVIATVVVAFHSFVQIASVLSGAGTSGLDYVHLDSEVGVIALASFQVVGAAMANGYVWRREKGEEPVAEGG